MDFNLRMIVAWSANRVNDLDYAKRYEDSYALTQEFCEWTTCLNTCKKGFVAATLMVPDFDKENRTSHSSQQLCCLAEMSIGYRYSTQFHSMDLFSDLTFDYLSQTKQKFSPQLKKIRNY